MLKQEEVKRDFRHCCIGFFCSLGGAQPSVSTYGRPSTNSSAAA
ncbi:hypothetical protein COPEUT_00780 [Coprococcus eutactus ATCC 27759]|nr:hypothetical protein COPEUT_00780 [Coprococcus eutactus ATCC 27759]